MIHSFFKGVNLCGGIITRRNSSFLSSTCADAGRAANAGNDGSSVVEDGGIRFGGGASGVVSIMRSSSSESESDASMGVGWVERRVEEEEAGGWDEYVVGFEGPAWEEDILGFSNMGREDLMTQAEYESEGQVGGRVVW